MDDQTYPKVLVINGEPFNSLTATGITLSSLFRGWPKDRLACLHLSDIPIDTEVCSINWRLSLEDCPFIRFTYSALRRFSSKGGTENSARPASRPSTARPPAPAIYSRIANIFPDQKFMDLGSYIVPAPILQAIQEFRPEVCYTILGANPVLKLAIDLGVRARLPVVPHFLDDWPSSTYSHSILRPFLNTRMRSWLGRILANPAPRLVIGSQMAEEFSRRYGGKFLAFMNAVEPSEYVQAVEPTSRQGKIRLIYAGILHGSRGESLREIAWALQELHHEGYDIEALIYTQHPNSPEAQALNLPPVMRVVGSLTPSQVAPTLREADILLHVESFDEKDRAHIRLSISTKIPQYLAAGKPILAFGPEGLASLHYVKSIGAGVVVNSRERGSLIGGFKQLLDSSEERIECGRRGLRFALDHHNADTQRQNLRDILASTARGLGWQVS